VVRILVVEDDEHLGRSIKRGLGAEGFATDLALDGVDGLWRARTSTPTVLVAGDLRLDPAAHRVWRGGAEVTLTPRQFALLEFLMRRAGEAVPKTTILEHVWDFAFEGDPNIVEVYVRHLRKKIDEPYGRNAIQTVRLVGYRLDPDGG
jgi:two-component system, OmpR family, response regulator